MVTIDNITVTSQDLTSLTIAWTFEETWEDLSPYTVTIYRSANNPTFNTTDFSIISSGIDPVSVTSYEDTTVSGYRTYKWADFYYSVVPYKITTGASGVAGTPARLETTPDLIAKEIIRRQALSLNTLRGGKPIYVLKRKKSGARCSNCWDSILQRRTVEKCTVCYDTGWTGGYWSQIQVNASLGPAPRRTVLNLFGEWEPQDSFLRMGPKPILSPQDVVVDLQDRRWTVAEVRPVEKGQYIIQQQARLIRINATDILSEYPITWS